MKTRSNTLELLDADFIPKKDLFRNLKELNTINTFLGGHKAVLNGFKKFDGLQDKLSILEIGSGGGDNLNALRKKNNKNAYLGVDLKEDCVEYARERYPAIDFICSDYRNVDKKVDLIFNSLFCHHFKNQDLIEMLKWMDKKSKKGFFILDLHRHLLAYWGIKIWCFFFSKSYLVKNDAPLSVKRGFKRKEWEELLSNAGIKNYSITWCWAFRYLIWVKKNG
jgi:2-polyprenyl-3-methyl-5-hydroxy-6-metoxy-1,4-benzoquinol methylase